MRGFKILEISLIVYLVALGYLTLKKPEKIQIPKKEVLFILYEDGYWKVNRDGWLIGVANENDVLKHAVVSGVDVEELKVSDGDVEILKRLKILDDPYVSFLNVRKRYVITVKGIVLYFSRWEDLERYFDEFKERMEYFSPGSVFYLYEGGRLVILRGD